MGKGRLKYLCSETQGELVSGLRKDLDFCNLQIGSRGPPHGGNSLDEYIKAIEETDGPQRARVGHAVNSILLQEALKFPQQINTKIVYNLLGIAQGVLMPEIRPSLGAFRYMQNTLEGALSDRNENLYYHAMIALAVNQGDVPLTPLWEKLIKSDSEDYKNVARIGFRKSGWELAVSSLPLIATEAPMAMKVQVMFIVDRHPEVNWPEEARELLPKNKLGDEIYELIQKMSVGRYLGPED